MWHIDAEEVLTAIKESKLLLSAGKWGQLEIIRLGKTSSAGFLYLWSLDFIESGHTT